MSGFLGFLGFPLAAVQAEWAASARRWTESHSVTEETGSRHSCLSRLLWTRRGAKPSSKASVGTRLGLMRHGRRRPDPPLPHHMTSPGQHLKWIPWPLCMSEAQEEKWAEEKATRIPKADAFAILQLAWDNPPRLAANEMGSSPYWISRLQLVRRNAFAMCQLAHLARLKALDEKFLSAYTDSLPLHSHLRAINLQELMEGERRVWTSVFKLVNEEGYKLDDALHEFTDLRVETSAWLQPRPLPAPSVGKEVNPKKFDKDGKKSPKGDGKKGGAQKGKQGGGKGKESKGKAKPTDDTCRRYNKGQCPDPACRYLHKCSFRLPNGKMCLKDHPAREHR